MNIRLDEILVKMIEMDAADVNITEKLEISYRVGKDIVKIPQSYVSNSNIHTILLDLTGSDQVIMDLYKPQEIDGSYKFVYNNSVYYFRYNISLTIRNVHISIRKLINKIPSFESIDLNDSKIRPLIDDMLQVREGLYLIVGATGSGKSTTIVTLLDHILQQKRVKTITLESPIEFYFDNNRYDSSVVIQKEIGRDTESFYKGVVAAMRQNPDILFVGEVRDKDTAIACMNAALTGHMVIATLHAKSIEKTKDRISYLLEDITNDIDFINGIIYQKLVKDKDRGVKAIRDVYINNN